MKDLMPGSIKPLDLNPLDLDPIERWNVFNRLQELAILCRCEIGQPLQVEVKTPTAALQVWSVVQRHTQPQAALADHLDRCWQQRAEQSC